MQKRVAEAKEEGHRQVRRERSGTRGRGWRKKGRGRKVDKGEQPSASIY